MLEDENEENISKQLKLFAERALPSLNQNIKCGNSLINTEIYTDSQFTLDGSEITNINAFDWNHEFSDVMKMGGFDAVIGNPPYLNIDDTWGKNDNRLRAIKKQYPEIYNDKTDILFYFLAKGASLSKGFVSFIVSRAFLEAFKADKLRRYLTSNSAINEIIDFQNFYVFEGVGITTCIITLDSRKSPQKTVDYKLLQKTLPSLELERYLNEDKIFERVEKDQKELNDAPWIFASDNVDKINKKLDNAGKKVGDILAIGKGMETGLNDVFGKRSLEEIKKWGLNKSQYFKRATNSDIQRYSINNRQEFLLYLEEAPKLKDLPEGVQNHLNAHTPELKGRAAFKRGNCEWWKYTWPLHKEWYDRPRLLCPYLAVSNRFALDTNKEYLGLTDTTVLFENGQPEDLKYILGLLNSQLLSFRFQSIAKLKSGGIREYFWNSVSKIPIHTINFSDPADKVRHDRMVELVTHMLDLNKRLQDAKLEQDKMQISRQIVATDAAIEKLVYELYGLTDEEIAVVKGYS
ncbi:Eco57I restriction-modification methylase domain-containing protein, partial [Methanoregula sp.]|uniref:Eco57I restriction-modification methylase domain-containing protein n=1 Tax=Methanoregula sp. TaxID=2052170 RepID=UPI003BB16758